MALVKEFEALSKVGLTDEEIAKEMGFPYPSKEGVEEYENYVVVDINDLRPLAEAQLKNVAEWGDEPCDVKKHYEVNAKRRECNACWQALSEEVKGSGDNDN